jgi:hypothetical protein
MQLSKDAPLRSAGGRVTYLALYAALEPVTPAACNHILHDASRPSSLGTPLKSISRKQDFHTPPYPHTENSTRSTSEPNAVQPSTGGTSAGSTTAAHAMRYAGNLFLKESSARSHAYAPAHVISSGSPSRHCRLPRRRGNRCCLSSFHPPCLVYSAIDDGFVWYIPSLCMWHARGPKIGPWLSPAIFHTRQSSLGLEICCSEWDILAWRFPRRGTIELVPANI